MSTQGRRAVALMGIAGAVALTGLASRIDWSPGSGDTAVLRLSWRARSARIEVCRHRTPEEIAKLPVHMREDEVCERRLLPYRLRVTVDSALVVDQVVRAAGAREDRPLYVFGEHPLAPGPHRVAVRFERQGVAPAEPPEEHGEEHGEARTAPPRVSLDTTLTFLAGDVVLLSYDEAAQRLVVRSGVNRALQGKTAL